MNMNIQKFLCCFIVSLTFLCFSNVIFGETLTKLHDVENYRSPLSVDVIFLEEQMSALPSGDTFARFSNLKHLIIKDNGLETVPADLCKGLHKLIQLDICGNEIKTLPGTLLHGAPNLQIAKFEGNRLNNVPADLFAQSPHLGFIDFSYNNFRKLPNGLFNNLPELDMLLLFNNQIRGFNREAVGLSDKPNLRLHFSSQNGNGKNPFQIEENKFVPSEIFFT